MVSGAHCTEIRVEKTCKGNKAPSVGYGLFGWLGQNDVQCQSIEFALLKSSHFEAYTEICCKNHPKEDIVLHRKWIVKWLAHELHKHVQ